MVFFRWIKKMFYLCYNNRILRYIWYGGWTTVVNLAVFYLLRVGFQMPRDIANVISVACAILFAYYVNSRFVFETEASSAQEHLQELVKFISGRLSTMIIEVGGVWLLSEVLKINDLIGKVLVQIIVLVMNYTISRFLVFRRMKTKR